MVGETIEYLTISLRCGEPFLEIDAEIAWFWRPRKRDRRTAPQR
jgi:hypothetical protein